MSSHKGFQTGMFLRGQRHGARHWDGHGQGPYRPEAILQPNGSMPVILHVYVAQTYWHRIYETDI